MEEYNVDTHESKVASDAEAAEMKFPWAKTQARLDASGGDFCMLEYLLPNGKPVSTTIGAYAHHIAAGKGSRPVQETAGNVFQVHAGKGHTEITSPTGEKTTLSWSKGDSFAVPAWYRFQNFADDEDVYLFAFSDKPLQVNLGFWRAKE